MKKPFFCLSVKYKWWGCGYYEGTTCWVVYTACTWVSLFECLCLDVAGLSPCVGHLGSLSSRKLHYWLWLPVVRALCAAVDMHAHTHMHARTHARTHTRTHTHIHHTHTHTCTTWTYMHVSETQIMKYVHQYMYTVECVEYSNMCISDYAGTVGLGWLSIRNSCCVWRIARLSAACHVLNVVILSL